MWQSENLSESQKQEARQQFKNCCVYCGDFVECQDHVTPVAYNSGNRAIDQGKTVDCCNMCNTLAGAFVAFNVSQKASYLREVYFKKYGKFIYTARWEPKELAQLKGMLRGYVDNKQFLSELLRAKLDNLLLVAQGHEPRKLRNYAAKLLVVPQVSPSPPIEKSTTKSCIRCGINFVPYRPKQKFCCAQCRRRAWWSTHVYVLREPPAEGPAQGQPGPNTAHNIQ